jgi:outer membrane receptor protein involved in Fe transport
MQIHTMSLLLAGTVLSAALPAQAYATDAPPPATEAPKAEDIIACRQRIVRDGYTAPTPVTVASADELAKSTPSSVSDALNKLPEFQNSLGPGKSANNFSNIPIHGNILNLRGLGTPTANPKGPLRTMIMVDGVRVAPTEYIGTIDTNVIPNLLLTRVDTVTGGASAAWGSDAVAGVVNFVLDKKFVGLKGNVQAGIAQQGDNDSQRIGIAFGTKFADDRGHLLLERRILPQWRHVAQRAQGGQWQLCLGGVEGGLCEHHQRCHRLFAGRHAQPLQAGQQCGDFFGLEHGQALRQRQPV